MLPVFVIGGLIISTAGSVITRDITQVWTTAAARSEVAYERRQGRSKLLLVREPRRQLRRRAGALRRDLEVDEGEIVALLGTNGAGKSTLLRAISGIVEADRGAIIFDGVDMTPPRRPRSPAAACSRCPAAWARSRRSPCGRTSRWPAGSHRRDAKAGAGRHRAGARAVPGARDPPARAGRQPLRRPAADARPRHGVPLEAAPADDRRAVARPGAGDRRAAAPAPARAARRRAPRSSSSSSR